MKHVDAFETTDLPERLGREFAAGAPCVAVLVAADGDGAVDDTADAVGGVDEPRTRRASATVFRVGDGYVVQCDDVGGKPQTVGMGSDQLDGYVERVRRDDAWTVLSIAEEGTGARRERPESGSLADR